MYTPCFGNRLTQSSIFPDRCTFPALICWLQALFARVTKGTQHSKHTSYARASCCTSSKLQSFRLFDIASKQLAKFISVARKLLSDAFNVCALFGRMIDGATSAQMFWMSRIFSFQLPQFETYGVKWCTNKQHQIECKSGVSWDYERMNRWMSNDYLHIL